MLRILYVGNDPNDLAWERLQSANGFEYEKVGQVYDAMDKINRGNHDGLFLASLRVPPITNYNNLTRGGFDIIEEARKKGLPIIVRTGFRDDKVHKKLSELGVTVLRAPNHLELVVPTVKKVFGEAA